MHGARGTRRLPAVAVAAALCAVAAGCGGGHSAQRSTPAPAPRGCVLSAQQRRTVAVVERDIRRLHRLEAPLTTFSQKGTPALQQGTNTVLLDIGRGNLPINTRARLLRLAKGAVGLCGLCFGALEAEEPVVASRIGHAECGGG